MSKEIYYRQVTLTQAREEAGTAYRVAWIEERFAQTGKLVVIKEEEGVDDTAPWTVSQVSEERHPSEWVVSRRKAFERWRVWTDR